MYPVPFFMNTAKPQLAVTAVFINIHKVQKNRLTKSGSCSIII